ncbi:DUF4040 family protein [Pseudokineococcus sp. 1T1Z-3]|uniref:DUF4040 family protein n=1 Tax=Pseudokineococcus sp. 1T1Z-3 TaxID=3132745 RepID=UPI003099BCAB
MILLVLVVLTAALAAAAPALARAMGRDAGLVLAGGLLALGLTLGISAPWTLGETVDFSVPWLPVLDVALRLRLDGLSLAFGLLVLLVGALVMAYSARYLGSGPCSAFYGLMVFFAAAMLVLVLADDLVLLFVAWEATTLCSFFLITLSGPAGQQPAVRTLLLTAGGGLALLAAVATTVVATGTTQLSQALASPVWSEDPLLASTVALLVMVAAFTKSAQFPFHSWLPDAMAASTPVSAYLHAAAMVKAGIYLLLRFSSTFADVPVWYVGLVGVGLLTALMGALYAMQRTDLKALLAYSTVSQLGFLVATTGIGTSYAVTAAVAHTVAHALFKSALFMLVGVVDHQAGTREIPRLRGLRRAMPVTGVAMAVAALSMAGVPPLLGFISKEKMFAALLEFPGPTWAGVLAGGVGVAAAVLTFAYSGRLVLGAFGGPAEEEPAEGLRRPREAAPSFLVPALVPAAAGVVLGLWGSAVAPLVTTGADAAAGATTTGRGSVTDADLSLWHGLNPELLMSATAIALGTVLVLARHRVDRALVGRRLFPLTGVGVVEGFRTGSIAAGARVSALTGSDAPRRHLAVPLVVLLVLAGVGLTQLDGLPTPQADLTRGVDWLLLALVVVGVVVVVRATSRLGALVVVGLVGFVVALWFVVLGAMDVALTQLLVEVLTVVVGVLVLRRLPRHFAPAPRHRTVGAAALAVGAGAAATAAVLAMTGRRGLSPAGEFFLARAEEETGGTNVVNTILVDFRALDTFGELTVLGIAGVAVVAALSSRRLLPDRAPRTWREGSPVVSPGESAVVARTLARVLAPLTLVVSLWLLWRGHDAPGGGFIGALVGAATLALLFLVARSDSSAPVKVPAALLIGAGVVLCVAVGLAGLVVEGSFLEPFFIDVGDSYVTTALVFDVGVYLTVVGVVVVALQQLGGVLLPGTGPGEDEPEHRMALEEVLDRKESAALAPSSEGAGPGQEQSGQERSGLERSGLERSGQERSGPPGGADGSAGRERTTGGAAR